MPTGKTTLDKVRQVADPEIQRLLSQIDRQQQLIEDLRKKSFRIPTGRPTAKGKTWNRVVIPDSHGAHLDPIAAKAFLDDLEVLKPREVVMLGDHMDCGGFLAMHHTLGFLPETDYTFSDDVEACNTFLDEIQKRCGPLKNGNFDYIEGNHEHRITKEIIKWTIRNPRDSAFLHRMFGLQACLGLDKRGIRLVERGLQYDGLQKRGTIRRGKCLFAHGTRAGIYACRQALQDVSANICTGHTHRISCFFQETVNGIIGSWQFGCLCKLHPLYGDTHVSNWAHGYGLQVCKDDGTFLTITVPILNGQSYLRGLLR